MIDLELKLPPINHGRPHSGFIQIDAKPAEQGHHLHDIFKIKKNPKPDQDPNARKYHAIHIAKEITQPVLCCNAKTPTTELAAFIPEVIAAEFLRLMDRNQPKTRILTAQTPEIHEHEIQITETTSCVVQTNFKYFIRSKEVPHYQEINIKAKPMLNNMFELARLISTGQVTGFGELSVFLFFLRENDANLDNFLLSMPNAQGVRRLIKIDQGRCFASLENSIRISIDEFPTCYASTFRPFNYLFCQRESKLITANTHEHKLVNMIFREAGEMRLKPKIQQEIYQAILKILLLPPETMQCFVDTYAPTERGTILDLCFYDIAPFLEREQFMLYNFARQNPAFIGFLEGEIALYVIREQIEYWREFQTYNKRLFFAENSDLMHTMLFEHPFPEIRAAISRAYPSLPLEKPLMTQEDDAPTQSTDPQEIPSEDPPYDASVTSHLLPQIQETTTANSAPPTSVSPTPSTGSLAEVMVAAGIYTQPNSTTIKNPAQQNTPSDKLCHCTIL